VKIQMRLFIGIPVTGLLRQQLSHVIGHLEGQKAAEGVRWHNPDMLHLTLRFLGETALSEIPEILAALSLIARQHQAFEVPISRITVFPPAHPFVVVAKTPRVEQLLLLQDAVENTLKQLGILPDQRSFKPHITLGRWRDKSIRYFDYSNCQVDQELMVDQLVLYSSEPQSGESRYVIEKRFALLKS